MRQNTKSLKRNDEVCKGILIAPLKLSRISRPLDSLRCQGSLSAPKWEVGFEPKSCGTDGKPTLDFGWTR
jgi:hypothetical protein